MLLLTLLKTVACWLFLSVRESYQHNFYCSQIGCWRLGRTGVWPGSVIMKYSGKTRWFGCGLRGLLLCGLIGCGGCWTDKNGTHQLIVGIGFGVVTTTNRAGVDVRDSLVLGVEAGPDVAGVGWLRHHCVVIDPALASNTVVSIRRNATGISVKNFDLFSNGKNNVQK